MHSRRHDAAQSRLIWPPTPGFFALALVTRGWRVPAQIVQTAHGVWYAAIDGEVQPAAYDPIDAAGVSQVWQSGVRIEQNEYNWLLDLRAWAQANDPSHPCLHPFQAISPAHLRPLAPMPPSAAPL